MNTDLDTLLAQQACRDLVLAAAEAVDGRQFTALAALFDTDGVLVRPDGVELRGRDAIVAAYAARDPDRLTRHLVSNQRVVVDLAAGTARSTCAVLLWSGRHSDAVTPRGRPADPVQQVGAIHDLLARTPEGWRIRRREAWFTLFQAGSTP
jgi:ketosteroid isomerase-like protein